MNHVSTVKPRRFNWLAWILLPLLLLSALVVGGFTMFNAHAASPLDGAYNFRGITTQGPKVGTYITGVMALTVSGNSISGKVCSLSYFHSHCTYVTGTTPDDVHVNLTFRRVNGFPDIQVVGAFTNNVGGHGTPGFYGTFSFGTSSGTWDARGAGVVTYTGSWNFYAIVQSGADKGLQFHGVLTLVQAPDGRITGTYCPKVGSCTPVTGGKNRNGINQIYIDLYGKYRFQGTHIGGNHGNRIGGSFQSLNPNLPNADRGYWVGHP